jgi:hypothetical protein
MVAMLCKDGKCNRSGCCDVVSKPSVDEHEECRNEECALVTNELSASTQWQWDPHYFGEAERNEVWRRCQTRSNNGFLHAGQCRSEALSADRVSVRDACVT